MEHSEEKLELTEEARSKVKKSLQEIFGAVRFLFEKLGKKQITKGDADMICNLLEHYIVELQSPLNYQGTLAKKMEERFQEIQEVNKENIKLRKQLGAKVSPEDVRENLKLMDDAIRFWWREEGFGHVSELEFGWCCVKVTLSGMMIGRAKKNIGQLQDKGFAIAKKDTEMMIASDSNVTLLEGMCRDRFPSMRAAGTKTSIYQGERQLRDFSFIIRDFDDVLTGKERQCEPTPSS